MLGTKTKIISRNQLILIICFVMMLAACEAAKTTGPVPAAVESSQQEGQPTSNATEVAGEMQRRAIDGMMMVLVPGGDFQMGSTDERVDEAISLCNQFYSPCNRWFYERESPVHTVTLGGFWMDQTEVSNAQYRLCVEAGICTEPLTCKRGIPTYGDPEKRDHPVVCVSWDDARNYCQWAGGRLPTEAEWEYASRGATGWVYPWGNEFDGSRLNYCDASCEQWFADPRFDDGYVLTSPVGSFPSGASWTGVLGLGGNVSEWVADWLGDYSTDALFNPQGPESGTEKILKGGSWFAHQTYCRGALRPSVSPETRFENLGFRCVMPTIDSQEGEPGMSSNTLVIPKGQPAALDGSLTPGEWDGARIEYFADESPLFLMQDGEFLYIGIQAAGPEMVAGNIFIQQGDKISILHTSAALGTAIYQESEEGWKRIQDFSWRCRNTGDSETARAERAEFLQNDGWLAATGLMGTPNELEYQIRIPEGDFRLAVVYVNSMPPYGKTGWPANLEDDCLKPTPGGFPEIFQFSSLQWGTLEMMK